MIKKKEKRERRLLTLDLYDSISKRSLLPMDNRGAAQRFRGLTTILYQIGRNLFLFSRVDP